MTATGPGLSTRPAVASLSHGWHGNETFTGRDLAMAADRRGRHGRSDRRGAADAAAGRRVDLSVTGLDRTVTGSDRRLGHSFLALARGPPPQPGSFHRSGRSRAAVRCARVR